MSASPQQLENLSGSDAIAGEPAGANFFELDDSLRSLLPLYMPVLIFGSACVQAAVSGAPIGPYLAILGAMLSLAIALAPLAVAAGLRISIDA